jgi:hypothetical protein
MFWTFKHCFAFDIWAFLALPLLGQSFLPTHLVTLKEKEKRNFFFVPLSVSLSLFPSLPPLFSSLVITSMHGKAWRTSHPSNRCVGLNHED